MVIIDPYLSDLICGGNVVCPFWILLLAQDAAGVVLNRLLPHWFYEIEMKFGHKLSSCEKKL